MQNNHTFKKVFNLSFLSRIAALLLFLFISVKCSNNVDFKYSDVHINLTIDNGVHQDATLASAMNAYSPGIFTIIKPITRSGVNYFHFANNHGLTSEKRFTAVDMRLQNYLRVGMNEGIIVGYGNLDNPAIFFAFDLQCPYCFNPKQLPLRSYELTLTSIGFANCKTCNRQYNLNTGGNLIKGNGTMGLTRYRCANGGPYSLLRVY